MENIINLSVVCVYIVFITIVGIWIGKKHSGTTEGYYLGGRKFNWVMIGLSLFATNVGMGMYVGGTGKAYKIGVAALTPELLGGLGLSLSAMIFIPIYLRTNITTLPQFLEKRFNKYAKLFYGGVFILLAVFISPLTMYTGSIAVLGLFGYDITGSNVLIVSLLIACTVGLYSILGGLTAVVITDMIQVVIMVFGSLLVAVIGIMKIGGLAVLFGNAPPDTLELLRPHDDPEFPWSAMLSGQLMASLLWAFSNIAMLQRVLGAKNLEHAQKGMLFGAGLKMFGLVLFIVPGMIAAQLYPDIAPDSAYVTLAADLLPVGLSGLVLAGMVAALMSSQDSGINALASIVSLDIYPTIRKNASQRENILVGMSVAVGSMVWGVIAAPLFITFEQGVFDLVLKFGGFLMVPNGICYLLGRFWMRGTEQGCIATLLCGVLLGAYYNLTSTVPDLYRFLPDLVAETHYYHLLPFFGLILAGVFVLFSLLSPPPPIEKIAFLDVGPEENPAAIAKPWYRTFGFWWAVYIVVFAALYIMF